ncbi:hypothetical protein O3P69_020148 [Scylla paramamosain]|uniref:Uncharacterized protein n=1 Tax=Scylla paramamosain TaxID=85552 RepID=A0AAW0TKL7_SCYPA
MEHDSLLLMKDSPPRIMAAAVTVTPTLHIHSKTTTCFSSSSSLHNIKYQAEYIYKLREDHRASALTNHGRPNWAVIAANHERVPAAWLGSDRSQSRAASRKRVSPASAANHE